MLTTRIGSFALALVAAVAVMLVEPPLGAAPADAQGEGPCAEPQPDETYEHWLLRCDMDRVAEGDGGGSGECVRRAGGPIGDVRVRCVVDEYGWWSNTRQCYLKPLSPQPPASDPRWDEHDGSPQDGLLYQTSCPYLHGVDGLNWVDPRLQFITYIAATDGEIGEIVEEAIADWDLAGPDIGIAPPPTGYGLVGLPVWLWVDNPPGAWQPQPLRLAALGRAVVITAEVRTVTWDMGDGTTHDCGTDAPAFEPAVTTDWANPDCGHTYQLTSRREPDGVYHVTATVHWSIAWQFEGTDVGATVTTERESSTTVEVRELQVLVGEPA